MKNKKGFTLMEMLIVVAIIAVLVAIAIPVLSNNLHKA
ncbi:MAG: prepilin-type N-terminal cleavage/methylation domain-containing protein, partial [Eubacteriales bacterium]|nr:prepilin-type N-terminal cleavage/methylation domain-containing protein [Eubacteriales bacterium]